MVARIRLYALKLGRRIAELLQNRPSEDEQGKMADHKDLKSHTQSPMHIMVDH